MTDFEVSYRDTFFLGCYPHMEEEVSQPIEWEVLCVKEDRVLLVSRYVLECAPFHHEDTAVQWKDCTLRKWLNNVFLYEAFTADERKEICIIDVRDAITNGYQTKDQIFLLSFMEARQCWKCYEQDVNTFSIPDAAAEFVRGGGPEAWWTCTDYFFDGALFGTDEGVDVICEDGSVYAECHISWPQGVRPAMWLHRSDLCKYKEPAVYTDEQKARSLAAAKEVENFFLAASSWTAKP